MAFELRALFIIVPFAVAVLLGCVCICKHKVELWRMEEDDPEAAPGASKLVVANVRQAAAREAEKAAAPSDGEAGNRGPESESDSILEPGKARKSFCG